MTDKIDAALALARRGFCVFPLVSGGKEPALSDNWRQIATKDPAKVRKLWRSPDWNIGIAIAPGFAVVDVDVRGDKPGARSLRLWEAINGPLPDTYEVTTASEGRHIWFKVPEDRALPGKLDAVLGKGCGIDIKQHGGYVVAPGSVIDGRPYLEANVAPVAPVPEELAALAGAVRKREAKSGEVLVELDGAPAIIRATRYLLHQAPDHGTYVVAAKVKDMGVSRDTCLLLLMEHWPPAAAKGEDHVSFRVDNAYSYGQNAVGSASPEAEFDAVEIDAKPAPKRGLHYVMWSDAVPDLNRPYLIDDVIDAGAMVVTYGDSNAGKTYVVLDQAFCIAAGREWNGHKVHQGLVVYIAAEGGGGFARRIEAFKRHYEVADVPFALVPCPINLHSEQSDTGKLIGLVRSVEEKTGAKCVLIVVDTLARAMAGGDENTATDMGRFVAHCDRLRLATGAAVNIIHHTGKDASKGARGSSALRAATDTELEVGGGQFTTKKQRDMAAATPSAFTLRTVQIGERADGKAITACVVEWRIATEFEERVSPMALKFHEILADAQSSKAVKADTWEDWTEWSKLLLRTIHSKPPSDAYFRKLKAELVNAGKIEETKDNQWVAVE